MSGAAGTKAISAEALQAGCSSVVFLAGEDAIRRYRQHIPQGREGRPQADHQEALGRGDAAYDMDAQYPHR